MTPIYFHGPNLGGCWDIEGSGVFWVMRERLPGGGPGGRVGRKMTLADPKLFMPRYAVPEKELARLPAPLPPETIEVYCLVKRARRADGTRSWEVCLDLFHPVLINWGTARGAEAEAPSESYPAWYTILDLQQVSA